MSVVIRHYDAPPVDKNEILRYMKGGREASALVDEALSLSWDRLSYRVCYRVDPCRVSYKAVETPYVTWESVSLSKALTDCDSVVTFAATLGIELDRLIARFGYTSPVRALSLSAVGSERIEALADAFCRDMAREYGRLSMRFSPGYGDFPLEAQTTVFSLLSPQKTIGLSLTDLGTMTPEKSVTALIGVKRKQ